ncbi:DUF3597 domain-containing protein [Falsiroseomonas sp. HW251]|uniref:DUF3597 domain-containing protein n=1 Tax=Falsiroseomonas sp. HW251 TaxID=3390998 RepID=UPI003D31C049
MSVFRSILSRVFGHGAEAAAPAASAAQPPAQEGGRSGGQAVPQGAPSATQGAAPPPMATQSGAPSASPAAPVEVDVAVVLEALAARNPQRLDWRHSIVDLMKLLDLDSSLNARKELAEELGYTGPRDGSAEMNLWLHRAVMRRLAENGGRVPDDLKG